MNEVLEQMKRLFETRDLAKCVEGLDLANSQINKIVELSISLLEEKKVDMFVISERLSLFFQQYLASLKLLANSDDKEICFWASTLLVHYEVNNKDAEEILINEVKWGTLDRAATAVSILAKQRNSQLKEAVNIRLKEKPGLESKEIEFFEEKLSELN